MSESKCIFAWTAPCKDGVYYPEYFNMSVIDDKVEITVRGPQQGAADQLGVECGKTSTMTLPIEQLIEMINMPFKALLELGKNGRLVIPA